MAQFPVVPPMPKDSEGASAGVVSVDQLRNPLSPEKADALQSANEQLHNGHAEAGMKRLQLALDDPACAGFAHAMLGTEFLKRGDLKTAIAHLQEAVRTVPGMEPAHSNLGYAYAMSGERSASMSELLRAISLDPSDPQPHFLLGLLLLNEPANYPDAKAHLSAAAPTVDRARLALAVLSARQEDFAAANKQVELFTPDASLRYALSNWIRLTAQLPQPAEMFGVPHSLNE